jgi:ketosteroid isomerase-like protein
MRRIDAAGFMVVAGLAGCQPAPATFTSDDQATVRAMFDSTVANIRGGDWVTWSGQFSENAVLFAPNAPAVRGRAAILAWGQSFPPVEELSFWDVQVTGDGNVAWGTSAYSLKLQGLPADTGKQLIVFRRSANGGWEIPAGGFSSDLPAPAAPPATPQN